MSRRRASRLNPEHADQVIDATYAKVPDVACKGLCHAACTLIDMSQRERARIAERHGVELPELTAAVIVEHGITTCTALTIFKRCGIYEDRPMICRLWGATEAMPCGYGCTPETGEWLTKQQADDLLDELDRAGGAPPIRRGQVPRSVLPR